MGAKKNKKKIIKWLWIIMMVPLGLFLLTLLYVVLFASIPSFEELENPKSNLATEIISEDGIVLSTFHIENRSYVRFDELAPTLVDAVVATEDVRFYRHSGIDFKSLARVGVKSILLGNTRSGGGGSTLTQQLAKSLFPRDTTVYSFPGAKQIHFGVIKLKEWVTAVKLERNYTKEELLSMYLNSVFFGSNAYGIRAASFTFFAKYPAQLNTEEAALLVGMVNKPSRFNPVNNPEESKKRRNHVLSQMSKYGFISKEEKDSLSLLDINLSYSTQDHNAGLGPYFRDMLRRVMSAREPERSRYPYIEDYRVDSLSWADNPFYGWLRKNPKSNGTMYDLDRDGLKIFTTINSTMQRYAEEAVAEHLGQDLQPAFNRELRGKRNRPFSDDVPLSTRENLVRQAQQRSDRYRNMKAAGVGTTEIEKSFQEKCRMRVFAWNKNGYCDTIMSPNDSILYYKSFLRASIMALEPNTGAVRAYVGGPNYRYFKYDNASQSKRQVGSIIKPFLYTLAMNEGFTPCDRVVNVPVSFEVGNNVWTPASTDKPEWIGQTVTLKWGLTKSSNNISAYLMKEFGPRAMIEMCRKLGISSWLDPVPPLCVGSADISLVEMAGAFNTFSSKGVFIEPFMVLRIEDKTGHVISSFTPRKREAISEQTAYLMINLMEGVVNEGTAARIRSLYLRTGAVAGKTGTTNDQIDGWFIGMVPKLTAAVWVGAEDRQVHFESLALGGGSNMALPIWGIFMKKVRENPLLGFNADQPFSIPPGMILSLKCDGSDGDSGDGNNPKDPYFNN
ncbi:MAG: transglycosylase domain-containing protein [Prevotellaceae bacterium]|jgi:penicillin-binding protein 1A|nr:transglycosylase domain-containing protein [Prevotellaceae bacterium]